MTENRDDPIIAISRDVLQRVENLTGRHIAPRPPVQPSETGPSFRIKTNSDPEKRPQAILTTACCKRASVGPAIADISKAGLALFWLP